MSSRVDDLLSRQRSLTGEPGLRREASGGRWYLQNWFLFGLAGALASFLVWAAFEPRLDDLLYIAGKVEKVDLEALIPRNIKIGMLELPTHQEGRGWIKIRDQQIWISWWAQEYRNGQTVSFDLTELVPDQEVGVYVEYAAATDLEGFAVARYLDLAPPQPLPAKSQLSLAQAYKRTGIASLLIFPFLGGAIGLVLGITEGLICRQFWRATQAGCIGLLVGLLGGFLLKAPSELLYAAFIALQEKVGSGQLSFLVLMVGRSLSWGLIGTVMGLGQGIALRSQRLLLYGLLGGVLGGMLGGLLFDPIEFMVLGGDRPSAHLSRMIGFTVIGLSVGVMIGVVQLLARDSWLRMTQGPLAGKEFLLFKDRMVIGAARDCDLFLFNDPHVMPRHAILRTVGDEWEIESLSRDKSVLVNDRSVLKSRVRHGSRITIGRTHFIIQMKQG